MVARVEMVNFIRFFVIVCVSFVFMSPRVNAASEDSIEDVDLLITTVFGSSMSEDKQAFEQHIVDLFYLSLDDVIRGIITQEIDMSGRKKYFSDAGWMEYQKYVSDHKEILQSKVGVYAHPQVMASLGYGTQEYSKNQNLEYFKAAIGFCYSSFDNYSCGDEQYKINLSVTGDFENPEAMIIEKWLVDFKGNK